MNSCTYQSPFGDLALTEQDGKLTSLNWGRAPREARSDLLEEALSQLAAYCAGTLKEFDVPVDAGPTDFQRAVGAAMQAIDYGQTRTYGEIARDLGVPAQAVGQACGANPVPIIIPCHRVMGAKGMTGFSGGSGVETKVALLRHEGGVLI